MHYPLIFFVIAVAFAYIFNDVDNPIHRYAARMVKVESKTLKEMDKNLEEKRGGQTSRCQMEGTFDYVCAPSTAPGAVAQYPHYFWGAPGAKTPRTASLEECKTACETKGRGHCAWRENGPELSGGTTCYFISAEICSTSAVAPVAFSTYLPSQVKNIRSGQCD